MSVVSVVSSEALNISMGVAGLAVGCISLLIQLFDRSRRR